MKTPPRGGRGDRRKTSDLQGFRDRLFAVIHRTTGQPWGKGWVAFARQCGIREQTFQNYVRRDRMNLPSEIYLVRIARVGGVSPGYLLFGRDADHAGPRPDSARLAAIVGELKRLVAELDEQVKEATP